ncbi:MAG: alpha-ketoglutarate-dependent dioxygenase AlkB [Woeseiaceae bacterium]|nr:alpha-ketoglutarate-dependent dioxygenase AlkB [Woeseiaceae bacterium]
MQFEQPEHLSVADADIRLWRNADLGTDDQLLLGALIAETPWRQEEITVWGKIHPQPRLIAWYGEDTYTYSGLALDPLPLTKTLQDIRRRVEAMCGASFNSVLLNYYRDHRDGMGFHADDKPELGPSPTIASVSLGEARRFVLKHRHNKDIADIKLPLPSGSVLLMAGPTQANWKHGIPKESKSCGPRVNLTFRSIRRPET